MSALQLFFQLHVSPISLTQQAQGGWANLLSGPELTSSVVRRQIQACATPKPCLGSSSTCFRRFAAEEKQLLDMDRTRWGGRYSCGRMRPEAESACSCPDPMGGLGPNFLLGSRDQMKSVDYCGLMLIHRIVINWWFWYVEKEGRPVPTGHMPYTQHDRLWTCCSVRSGESSDRSSECQHQGRTLIRSPFRKSCSADREFKVRTLNSIVKT